ncbi:hypothetical protein CRE_06495 [Caenorhabditis remanei]|uniref:Uncharacterized protein n=1 Tax=Caenorhabditis remanei TaxID=31234 RepID=E3M132_CAERE|nr:hypothetical protein CRE_06495 [Caenorhabditis remanei]
MSEPPMVPIATNDSRFYHDCLVQIHDLGRYVHHLQNGLVILKNHIQKHEESIPDPKEIVDTKIGSIIVEKHLEDHMKMLENLGTQVKQWEQHYFCAQQGIRQPPPINSDWEGSASGSSNQKPPETFEEALELWNKHFPTDPGYRVDKDLTCYLFNPDGEKIAPQIIKQAMTQRDFYQSVCPVTKGNPSWTQLSEDEQDEWATACKQMKDIQKKQLELGLIKTRDISEKHRRSKEKRKARKMKLDLIKNDN